MEIMLDRKTKEIISKDKDLVLDLAKRIYANNSNGINEQMRVDNAENAIKAAAVFVEVWKSSTEQ